MPLKLKWVTNWLIITVKPLRLYCMREYVIIISSFDLVLKLLQERTRNSSCFVKTLVSFAGSAAEMSS